VPDATLAAAEGAADSRLVDRAMIGIPRALYLYENKAIQPLAVWSATTGRALYLYENRSVQTLTVLGRALYLYENRSIWDRGWPQRALYLYEATRDTEVFPWLMKLDPAEQVRGGQVDLMGDGFGSVVEVGAAATLTASSTNGSSVPGQAVDRTMAAEWVSNDGAGAWLRFTFATPQPVVAVALADRAAGGWGIPLFRFSDAGADVVGAGAPVVPSTFNTSAEYPVSERTLYTLPATRTCTWLEVRVSSGGSGTNRGLSEAWVLADQDVAAETSEAYLRLDAMGIAAWTNRSPGLYPANSGQPITAAATVTVPPTGDSGLVRVVENT
jgi:hypothetical protein